MADRRVPDTAAVPASTPDYDLPESLTIDTPAQYKALFEETRSVIVNILLERAATTSELAAALERPKGTVGHHLKVLEAAGLVHVVRTEKVRALEAKYYGRTARVFWYHHEHDAVGLEQRVLARAAAEIPVARTDEGTHVAANVRYARIPQERARQWHERLDDLVLEFGTQATDGETTYALVYGLYPTRRRALTGTGEPEAGEVGEVDQT